MTTNMLLYLLLSFIAIVIISTSMIIRILVTMIFVIVMLLVMVVNGWPSGGPPGRWASWKDGCHLITKAPECSATYCDVVAKVRGLCSMLCRFLGFTAQSVVEWFQDFGVLAVILSRGVEMALHASSQGRLRLVALCCSGPHAGHALHSAFLLLDFDPDTCIVRLQLLFALWQLIST